MAQLDLAHLQRVVAILDGIPGGTDLPHALVALEDALVMLQIALGAGLSLERARALQHQLLSEEETRRLLVEHGRRPAG